VKVLGPLLDPAPWLVLLLAIGCVLAWVRRRAAAERLVASLALLLTLLCTLPPLPELGARWLLLPEARGWPGPGAADLLVVLGGGLGPRSELAGSSIERTVTAVRLWRQGVAPRLLFSGVESRQMAELASALGVPSEHVSQEGWSSSTWENAVFSRNLLRRAAARRPGDRPDGLPRIVLVTSATHLRRAQRAFAAVGFAVTPAAAPHPFHPAPPQPIPSTRRAALVGRLLYEAGALAAYELRGWQAPAPRT